MRNDKLKINNFDLWVFGCSKALKIVFMMLG